MNLRKLGGLAALALVLFYAISNPQDSADFVRDVASGVGAFASALVK
ncbi:hypothetical protein [Couchioplanes azureus]|nr:hypothetical protein [Couchioplanes caeruleus]GGQ67120.1 hypothetical protein GCM10010166_41190 [Couchioplanes caeruleus subsp. azureus]